MAIPEARAAAQWKRCCRAFLPLAFVSIFVSAIVAISDWVIDTVIYAVTGTGVVYCNATVFGVMLPCGVGFWITFLVPAGLCAALITAFVYARLSPSNSSPGLAFGTRDRFLVSALGPLAMLYVSVCVPVGLLQSLWLVQGSAAHSDGIWEIVTYIFYWKRLLPYALAALLGSAAFWLVLVRCSLPRSSVAPKTAKELDEAW